MKHVWFRAAAVGVAVFLLAGAYKRAEPSSVMADAANAFLNSLWPDQKAKASYAFDDDERLSWHLYRLALGEVQQKRCILVEKF